MASAEQLVFPWSDPPKAAQPIKPPHVLMPHTSWTYDEILPDGAKWDFETTFPQPSPDAFLPIEDPAVMQDEAVAAVHEEHTRHCLAILADTRTVNDSIRTGVDPRTRKVPSTQKAKKNLSRHLGQATQALAGEFEEMLGAYTSAFGTEAGAAFRAYLIRRDAELASESDEPLPAPQVF